MSRFRDQLAPDARRVPRRRRRARRRPAAARRERPRHGRAHAGEARAGAGHRRQLQRARQLLAERGGRARLRRRGSSPRTARPTRRLLQSYNVDPNANSGFFLVNADGIVTAGVLLRPGTIGTQFDPSGMGARSSSSSRRKPAVALPVASNGLHDRTAELRLRRRDHRTRPSEAPCAARSSSRPRSPRRRRSSSRSSSSPRHEPSSAAWFFIDSRGAGRRVDPGHRARASRSRTTKYLTDADRARRPSATASCSSPTSRALGWRVVFREDHCAVRARPVRSAAAGRAHPRAAAVRGRADPGRRPGPAAACSRARRNGGCASSPGRRPSSSRSSRTSCARRSPACSGSCRRRSTTGPISVTGSGSTPCGARSRTLAACRR